MTKFRSAANLPLVRKWSGSGKARLSSRRLARTKTLPAKAGVRRRGKVQLHHPAVGPLPHQNSNP